MLLYQLIILALIQGLTEFLPISSSAHLILPSQILGWPDQGLIFDLAVHLGTLIAVLIYLRVELLRMCSACLSFPKTREFNQDIKLALLIMLATLPAVVIGFFIKDFVEQNLRSLLVIALTSIGFGLVLAWADFKGKKIHTLFSMNVRHSLVIGFAQVLAFIPGTSRSGITLTAALALGYERTDALRFSFLLSIPLILAGSLLGALELINAEVTLSVWRDLLLAMLVSGVSAYVCMHLLITWVNRVGMLPFVIYRVLLGFFLLWFALQMQ